MSSRTTIMDAVTTHASHSSRKDNRTMRWFSVLLFSVFVVVDLLALMAGTSSYGSLMRMQAKNDQLIMTSGPIVSSVRANDAQGGVTTGEGPEGSSLVLLQSDSQDTYETRIYLYHGHIVQEYALGGSTYAPQTATVLAESSSFSFSYEDGLLTIATDSGVTKVALRTQQGGA